MGRFFLFLAPASRHKYNNICIVLLQYFDNDHQQPVTRIKLQNFIFLLSLLLGLALPTPGNAQDLSEYIAIDSLKVGDTFDFSITLNRSEQYDQVIFPDSADLGDAFEIRSRRQYQVSSYKDSLTYKLQFFATSDTTLPQLPVYLIQAQDTTVLYTNPVPIQFSSVLAEEEQEFRPLKPIFDFAAAWWPYILGLLILLAAGYLFYTYYWQQRETEDPKEQKIFTPKPFINPIKELQETIQELEQSEPSNKEDFKEFYIALGDAIRRYYENLHKVPALESTSRELLTMIQKRAIDEDLVADTRAVLQEADMVKFANFTPTTQQAQRALKKARDFLERARDVDGPQVQHLRRQHHEKMQAEREQFNRKQENEEVNA